MEKIEDIVVMLRRFARGGEGMRRIVFNLKREWYNAIASGEKTVEYRRVCKHWAVRLGIVWPMEEGSKNMLHRGVVPLSGWIAVFRMGYTRKHPDIVRLIEKIDIGPCPYEGWDGEYFRVHFEGGKQ